MNQDKLPLLAAYRSDTLNFEAAGQLAQMLEDQTAEVRTGEDLPEADRAALLRKVCQPAS